MAGECAYCGEKPEEDKELNEDGLCEDCEGFVGVCTSCDRYKSFDELDEDEVCDECREDEDEDEEEEDAEA